MFADSAGPKEGEKRIEAVDKALCILECFSDAAPELTLKALSEQTGLNKSRILRLCGTLAAHGFLIRRKGSLYALGPGLLILGKVYERANPLISLARPIMHALALQTGESVKLFAMEEGRRVCIARELGPRRLHYVIGEGESLPLLAGAGGKVLMAHAPQAVIGEILRLEGLERRTPSTIVRQQELFAEFDRIRSQGYAVSKGELVPEVGGIAAPIYNADDRVVAALTVAGPIQRFSDDPDDQKIKDLLTASQRLSGLLGHRGSMSAMQAA